MNGRVRSFFGGRYEITGLVLFLAGAAYTARALHLIRSPGELPLTNTYPLILGVLLCLCAAGIYFCGRGKNEKIEENNKSGLKLNFNRGGLFAPMTCFIAFALVFESMGAIKASFAFSFLLGALWIRSVNKNKSAAFLNILAACACAAGIWLVFEMIFSLSLP